MSVDPLRAQLARLLTWQDAHVPLDDALAGLPVELQGARPHGVPYSCWQLLEHLRIAQRDILDFCRDAEYRELRWPDDYWPAHPAPPAVDSWERSVEDLLRDRAEVVRLLEDPGTDLFAEVPQGSGQTYLREFLLVADHNAYHLGEIVLLRRALGAWPPP